MLLRRVRRHGNHLHVETLADGFRNLPKRDAFFSGRVVTGPGRTLLQRQPVQAGGVGNMGRRPPVQSVADIGGDALFFAPARSPRSRDLA